MTDVKGLRPINEFGLRTKRVIIFSLLLLVGMV